MPEWMEPSDVKAFLMQDLDGLDAEVFEPTAERITTEIFRAKGNARRLITPLALSLARKALAELETING